MKDFREFRNRMEELMASEAENLWIEKDIRFHDNIEYNDTDYKALLEFDQFLSYLEDIEWLITEKSDFDFEFFLYPDEEKEE